MLGTLANQRKLVWAVLTFIFLATLTAAYYVVENAVANTVEQQALSVAEIVAAQATTARSVYAKDIAAKLQRDGTGPHVDSAHMPGYIPIPAEFLKMLGLATAEVNGNLFQYKPISKWNLEPTQGISDEFLTWAWPQLEAQDNVSPTGPLTWKSIWRFESKGDAAGSGTVLRYLYADPASQASCVNCHNEYENRPDVVARRIKDKVTPGKRWREHQLLGALSVTIPLERVETAAGMQIRKTSLFVAGLLLPIFLIAIAFNIRVARKDFALKAAEKQLEQTEQEARNANLLLLAKQGVEKAFAELSTYLRAIDQHALVSVIDPSGLIVQANGKYCELSGYKNEELVEQKCRMGDAFVHTDEFCANLWHVIGRGDIWKGEICIRAKSGGLNWLDSAIVPLKDDTGQIERYISIQIDCTERKQAAETINELSFFDQLTGLPNRTLLLDRLSQSMTSCSRSGDYGAVLFIDLDNFKTLNDTRGHDMGDLLLKQIAYRLTSCVRAQDSVARMGGDEFIVILVGLGLSERDAASQTELIAKKILRELDQTFTLREASYYSTSSIGAALFGGRKREKESDVESLLKQADLAMYKAKESGRNAVRFFDPDMEIAVMTRAALEKDLREAVRENQFFLHYQPQMAAGQLTGAEALVRWQHPQRGTVSPLEFIPLAEATGLILPLGLWVLEAACDRLAAWASRPKLAHLTIAVNVSASQFLETDFVEQVLGVINKSGANPQRLKLELTESLLVTNVDTIIDKMFTLKAKGVGFSLDDFGTGYSSLSYLKRLPLDQLKIDQSFVCDILTNPNDAAIAKTIIALGQSLGLGVIAEGVESAAQRDFLASAGCHAYQGFFFSRPLAQDQFDDFAHRF